MGAGLAGAGFAATGAGAGFAAAGAGLAVCDLAKPEGNPELTRP